MTPSVSKVALGATDTFTITVTNTGANALPSDNSVVVVTLPSNLTLAGAPAGATVNGNTISFPLGTLAANGHATFSITTTASGAASAIVSASLTSPDAATATGNTTVKISPRPMFAIGADAGGAPEVKVIDSLTGAVVRDFNVYGPMFKGGVRVAMADVNGDGVLDLITAAGPGGGPHVQVFDGVTGNVIASFFAYDPGFTGGTYLAAADVNGDGKADIIIGAGAGGGPHVKVIDGTKLGMTQANGAISDAALLDSFFAYSTMFTGGVRVAAADVNGDGKADIITGAGPGGGPHVKVFDAATLHPIYSFFAFDGTYTGGVFVAGGDLDGDGKADIVVSQGSGTSAHVRTFSGATGLQTGDVVPFTDGTNGVRVTTSDRDGDGLADVIVGTGTGTASRARSYKGTNLGLLGEVAAFDPSFLGGIYVG